MTGMEVAAIASIASAGMSIAGGMQQAGAAKANARAATAQAGEEERRFRVESMKRAGASRNAAASQGAGLDSLDILSDNAANEELDALFIKYGGQVKSAQFKAEAKAAKMAGFTSAATSLAGGFGGGSEMFGSRIFSGGKSGMIPFGAKDLGNAMPWKV